jgi:hypothetical protein
MQRYAMKGEMQGSVRYGSKGAVLLKDLKVSDFIMIEYLE